VAKSIEKSIIEKIKSGLLVVLTISAILLLYFFWGNISLDDFDLTNNEEPYQIIDSKEVITPDQIIVSMGEDSYLSASPDHWSEMMEGFREFTAADSLIVEEITKDQYETVMQLPSVRAKFSFPISLPQLLQAYGIKENAAYDNVANVTEVGYGSVSKESLLVFDAVVKKYYRIITSAEGEKLDRLLRVLQMENGSVYFSLGTLLGGDVDNGTLIPLSLETNLRGFEFYREDYFLDKEVIGLVAQSFFGKTFDFVRKIEEGNGTVIYMYGYGEKVLIVNNEGVLEYKEETTGSGNQGDYITSLQTALNFIAGHGGFESVNGIRYTPYLKQVRYSNKGYQFAFGIKLHGHKICYQDKDPITIEVTGNQVSYFRRDLGELDEKKVLAGNEEYREAYSAINMLAQNYEYLINPMGFKGTFEEIAENITGIDPVYVIVNNDGDEKGQAMPVWLVTFDKLEAYFDLYSTEPVGYHAVKN